MRVLVLGAGPEDRARRRPNTLEMTAGRKKAAHPASKRGRGAQAASPGRKKATRSLR
jgi:hypothetical protein